MSFGFSVGDILLVSQLSYNLYGTFTTGRKGASSSYTELSDALFGLRCALDHLSHYAAKISSSTALADWDTNKLLQNLDTLIRNCATTLNSLQDILDKYADDVPDAPATDVPLAPGIVGKRQALKRTAKVTISKVKWTTEEKTLAEIRIKLQSHTAAIDLVVNTFLWASTRELHGTIETLSDKTEEMHKMILDNSDSPRLIKEIHQLLLGWQQARQVPAVPPAHLVGHRNGNDANGFRAACCAVSMGEETVAEEQPLREPENELQARISAVNRQRALAAHRTPLPKDPQRLPVKGKAPDLHYYRTAQTPSPPTLSVSPSLWLRTLENTLTMYLSSPTVAPEEKRRRQIHIQECLSALNMHLSSIQDKASRRNVRRQLEEGAALARTFEKGLRVLMGSVVLRKLIETYEDDKADDEDTDEV